MEVDVQRRQGAFSIDARFSGAAAGVTALFGPSGAGKSSLVNMVAGLMRPDSGRISINGSTLFDAAQGINLPPEKRRIGYVFQDGRLLPHLSVRANLTYGMHRTPASQRFVGFDPVVELLGIGHLLQRRPARLSGGEKQRVAIGRALLTSPALLLMDEPLASLDASRKAEVLPFVMQLSRQFAIPILYVSHALDEILNLADHLVLLEDGRVAASGKLEELFSNPELQARFGTDDSGSVLATTVETADDGQGLTWLRFADKLLKVRRFPALPGAKVRVRIPARQVAIALSPPDGTSFQNIFAGRVTQILAGDAAYADVCIDIGRPLWARITRKSLVTLELKPGQSAFALIKSVAVSV